MATPQVDNNTPSNGAVETFPYQALESGNSSIRLIRLQPAIDFSSAIYCDIYHVSLDTKPEFEALSYAWGDANITETIYLERYAFQATVNLVSALRHIRLTQRPRILWVDALCIDQLNLEERGSQVAFMGKVYSMATRDILWIGEDSHGVAEDAFEYVKDVAALWDKYEKDDVAEMRRKLLASGGLPSIDAKKLDILSKVFDEPAVLKRIWIVQEIAMAQAVEVFCGFRILSWMQVDKFFNMLLSMASTMSTMSQSLSSVLQASWATACLVRARWYDYKESSDETSIFSLWSQFCSLEATDPRDKLFSLIGLSRGNPITITPDYTKPIEEVCVEAVCTAISTARNLNSLCLGHRGPTDRDSNLPTWVPDFGSSAYISEVLTFDRMKLYGASGTTPASPTFQSGLTVQSTQLITSGIWVDIVSKVHEPVENKNDWTWKNYRVRFREMLKDTARSRQKSYTTESAVTAVMRTLVADCNEQGERLSKARIEALSKSLQRSLSWIGEASSAVRRREDPDITFLLSRFLRQGSDYPFGITSKGFMSLVPDIAKVGDVACVLYGSNFPHILRPVPGVKDTYQMIGICYLHNFMDGEALKWRDQGKLEERRFRLV